jgi:hypothetical protein
MSGISIGDTPVTGIYYGSTPITSVYKGSTKIWPSYTDAKALHLDGTSQYVWKADPSFKDDSAGSFAVWIRINTLLTTDMSMALCSLADAGTQVGSFGKSIAFDVRRNAGYGNGNNYLDITFIPDGSNPTEKSGSTPLTADTWMHVYFDSDGKICLNGVEETYQYWSTHHFTAGWFSDSVSANKDFAIGARRVPGSAVNFADVDFNNWCYYSRALTFTEVELLAADMSVDPALAAPTAASALVSRWDFEGNANDAIGSNNATEVDSPIYVDI